MIFPKECKFVGNATTKPLGEKVYCLTQYLIHPTPEGLEVLHVTLKKDTGIMREIESVETIAGPDDIFVWLGDISTPHDRVGLIKKAMTTGKRCTIFGDKYEHMTFILDPDLSEFQKVHVYDVTPPKATLSATLSELEKIGFFELDNIMFEHHIRDISSIDADVYPCRAGGFSKTLDRDKLIPGEKIACCRTGRQITHECYDETHKFEDICPLSQVNAEPFIARCCRMEDSGIRIQNGFFGVVVHWASTPKDITKVLEKMLEEWRLRNG